VRTCHSITYYIAAGAMPMQNAEFHSKYGNRLNVHAIQTRDVATGPGRPIGSHPITLSWADTGG